MQPFSLQTARLVLDEPVSSDRDRVAEYCSDPLFEHTMTIPWPYELKHADSFLQRLVPRGWESGAELTWALREAAGEPLLGAIGWRRERSDIGFWLGAPHRGRGLMTEAVNAVTDRLFADFGLERILWECVIGNAASVSVARKAGFHYTGEAPADVLARDGSRPPSWHGVLTPADSHEPKPGWPGAPTS